MYILTSTVINIIFSRNFINSPILANVPHGDAMGLAWAIGGILAARDKGIFSSYRIRGYLSSYHRSRLLPPVWFRPVQVISLAQN